MSKGRARRGDKGASGGDKAKSPSANAPRAKRPADEVRVSKPGDRHEKEADAAADRVMRGLPARGVSPLGGETVGRKADDKKKDEEPPKEEVKRAADDKKKDEAEPKEEVKRAADEKKDEKKKDEEPPKEEVKRAADDKKKDEEAEPKEEVKRAADDKKKDEEAEPKEEVHPKSKGEGGMGAAAQQAIANPGAGRPMYGPTRRRLESGLGADLSNVRVHDDPSAHRSADALQARAFTHGNDIWLGHGESDRDLHLMAHESAHVLQDQGSVRRAIVHRQTEPPSGNETKFTSTKDKGEIDTDAKTITLPKIRMPAWKLSGPDGLSSRPNNPIPNQRPETSQVSKWEREVRGNIKESMVQKLERGDAVQEGGSRLYFLRYKSAGGYLVGTKAKVIERARRPDWDQEGKPHYYDVDHFQEMQVGGADAIANYWLLDAQANQTSGSAIDVEVDTQIGYLLTEAEPYLRSPKPSVDAARTGYKVSITRFVGGLPGWSGDVTARWTMAQVQRGDPVDALEPMTKADAEAAHLVGPTANSWLTIFTSDRGGASVQIELDAQNKPKGSVQGLSLWPDFSVETLDWTGTAGTVTGTGFKGSQAFPEKPVEGLPLTKHGSLPNAAVVNGRHIEAKIRQSTLQKPKMSPVEFTSAELRDGVGIYATGILRPSIPLLQGTTIDIVVEGQNITFQKRFAAEELKFPGPIKVTSSSLVVGLGTRGLTVAGEALFEVERLGKGKVGAEAGVGAGGAEFAVEGEFEFDSKLFDKAKIKAWYRNEKFGGEGQLKINKGKFKGIDGATLDAKIDGEKITATGVVDVAIKGVDKGKLDFKYDPATGVEIGGSLALTGDIPGIQGGSLEAKLSQAGDKWKLGGAITATPSIPGVSGSISGEYDDGAMTVQGTLGYEKGMLKGSVTLGATNRAVNDAGQPSGEATEKLTAFGGGQVTIQIAPWLKGTIGLKLKPNGQIIVSGEVALPDTLDIFPEKKVEKNIFSINLDIPIVGMSVAGQRVGIFATIGGGLDATAGIGPGQLRQVKLSVQYNPEDEADTKVNGHAQLYIPAHAGMRMFIKGGLGAGIPLVSATAGLEIGGTLGIEGAAEANVDVNWSPGTGLSLDADVGVHAQPSFTFDITGFVKVEFDYIIDTVTLYEKRWQLASFKYGSDMQFGIKFPFHYHEGQPFDVSLSDVEFEYPQIEPGALLSGLVGQIAG